MWALAYGVGTKVGALVDTGVGEELDTGQRRGTEALLRTEVPWIRALEKWGHRCGHRRGQRRGVGIGGSIGVVIDKRCLTWRHRRLQRRGIKCSSKIVGRSVAIRGNLGVAMCVIRGIGIDRDMGGGGKIGVGRGGKWAWP